MNSLPSIFVRARFSTVDADRDQSWSKRIRLSFVAWLGAVGAITAAIAAPVDDVYRPGPDSMAQPGVPQGKVSDWTKLPSEAYPGTLHDYCTYVPSQYDLAKPAALMIFQDGQAW